MDPPTVYHRHLAGASVGGDGDVAAQLFMQKKAGLNKGIHQPQADKSE